MRRGAELESLVEIEHYGPSEPEMMGGSPRRYPFRYDNDDLVDLPTLERHYPDPDGAARAWARSFARRAATRRAAGADQRRSAAFRYGNGSSAAPGAGRDPAPGQRHLPRLRAVHDRGGALAGLAARFVSGYLYDPGARRQGHERSGGGLDPRLDPDLPPGAGWVEFDPTNGLVGGPNLIRVGVARDPRQAIPLRHLFRGIGRIPRSQRRSPGPPGGAARGLKAGLTARRRSS